MSEIKTVEGHKESSMGKTETHETPVDLKSYIRTCAWVFVVVVCSLALMLWASYLPQEHYSWPFKVAIILAIACCNAFVVAGFLMHLLSEKKLIYTMLSFTVFFAAAMMWLTVYAMHDFPSGTTH